MGPYIARRVVATLILLVVVSMVVFALFAVIPADPARLVCGKACTPSLIKSINHQLGYDRPIWVQYAHFVKGIFAGRTYGEGKAAFTCAAPCLGYSFVQNHEVTSLITARLPVTIQLAVGGFVMWIVGGVGAGIIAALRRGRWQDRSIMSLAIAGYSFPSFFIADLLVYFIQIKWGIIGFDGYVSFFDSPWQWFTGLLLPWIAVALLYAAFYSRLTRNQMLEVFGEDYIRTARAKGLKEGPVVVRHALRSVLTPIVSAAGLDLAGLLGGAIIIESVFSLPGIGQLSVDAVTSVDLPIITATTLIAAMFILVANLVVDLLYAVIDPRVRLA